MTTAELLLQDFDIEMASTRRTLERIPEDKAAYKPHEKSMPLGQLALHVATLPGFAKTILTTPSLDLASAPRPDMTFHGREATLATFDALAAEARTALVASSDADLSASWRFSFGDHLISDAPRSLAFRHMFFNHLIHHRAQLGVYLRLNNIPVPGVYGPSADEPFKP
ncbi:MAG: DinB family protein [Acidobacteriaceae bacterium]|nr:DinB family protein [Acidobacteriaceae bacterium]